MGFLDSIKILSSLSQDERNNLANFCQERKILAGEVLFNEGDEANAMYILKSGIMAIYKEKDLGEDVLIGRVQAEEILGEMALFRNNGVRMAKAVAEVDSEVVIVLSFSINELTKKNPEILKKIEQIIEERVIKNKTLDK